MASCYFPQKIKGFYVACGHCSACLENRRQQWKFRAFNERKYSTLCCHVTLTFSPEFVGDNVCSKKELQNFFKRCRNHGLVFRYIAIGEYGTNFERKHYHVGVFSKNCTTLSELRRIVDVCWPFGIVYYTPMTDERIGYILHYHIKPKEVNNKPTCFLYSKGFGSEWFLDNDSLKDYIVNSKSVRFQGDDGSMYSLPRYYRKKIVEDIDFTEVYKDSKTIHDKIAKRFKKPYFELSKEEKLRVYMQFKEISDNKLNKYNHKRF